jgi:hypothetical protein
MRRWGARLACAVATCEGNHLVLHEVGNGDGGEQAPATGDGAPHGHTSWLRGGLLTTKSRPAFLALESTMMLGWANAGCGGVKKSRAEARGSTRAGAQLSSLDQHRTMEKKGDGLRWNKGAGIIGINK